MNLGPISEEGAGFCFMGEGFNIERMSRGISRVEGRAGSDKDFEAKLRRLEGAITLGQERKIRK